MKYEEILHRIRLANSCHPHESEDKILITFTVKELRAMIKAVKAEVKRKLDKNA